MIVLTSINERDRGRVTGFLDAIGSADGQPPLSEYKMLRLDGSRGTVEQLLVTGDGSIVGYGQAAWHRPAGGSGGHWAVEVVVAPDHRSGPAAATLIGALEKRLDGSPITLWAHTPYVATAAGEAGWLPNRLLTRMSRRLPVRCRHEVPDGLSISTFRPGIDEWAWLSANNLAFAEHPENGALELSDIVERERQAWFDPEGFFLAWDGDRVVGSCWTKVHEGNVGEIYIIGIIPEWEGMGLGRALVCCGLDYLSAVRQAVKAMLYVELDNERAADLYLELGFEVEKRITAYSRDN
jgi:mycothiol synthase